MGSQRVGHDWVVNTHAMPINNYFKRIKFCNQRHLMVKWIIKSRSSYILPTGVTSVLRMHIGSRRRDWKSYSMYVKNQKRAGVVIPISNKTDTKSPLDSWTWHSRFLCNIALYSIGSLITRNVHNWVLFLLWLHHVILSGVISPLISSSILGT